jgi:alpha-ketoglutarate-dependent 2,4-dichlorophenoxyacetate dioxygenase
MEKTSSRSFSIETLGPGFGVQIRGIGLQDVVESDAACRVVRAMFEEHSVLLFRNQKVTDDLQLAFSKRFGPLENPTPGTLADSTYFTVLTNIDPVSGALVPPDHKESLRAKANQLWHTDSSFKQTPALASILSARAIPPTGGETEFASTRLAWDRLPADRRAQFADAFAWHSYAHSRSKIDPGLASAREKNALPPAHWRMRWRNPANGRDALYVASHTYAIDGMSDTDAQSCIDELITYISMPGCTFEHRWKAGDVIMWDNRAVLHRGRPWPGDAPRHMVRTTVAATDADGLAEMRYASAGSAR